MSTLLVGTDGSDDAANAVEFAAGLADQAGATVVLVHAMTLLDQFASTSDARATFEQRLRTEWSEPLRRRDLDYRCVLDDGPPLLVLPRVAAREGVDLIVVASHGEGNSHGLILGSTCHGLLQVAAEPVLVVPTRRGPQG